MLQITRRRFCIGVASIAGAGFGALPPALAQTATGEAATALPGQDQLAEAEFVESHGMSMFGNLAYGADFPHFSYVDPAAPRGGEMSMQISSLSGNQNFNTFDTLNIYVLQGAGAAGMGLTFESLMTGSGDEPDAAYGLVARTVARSRDGLVYRFRLRPEARFHDGSPITASDVAFSMLILKEQGHPRFRQLLTHLVSAEALAPDHVEVRLAPERSRDLPLIVAGLPIFSESYWSTRDFTASTLEAPLGSGPYRVARFAVGRNIVFERVPDHWAANLAVNVGRFNFERIRYEYFRDRQVAFEAFKAGQFSWREEFTSREWARGYDFPARRDGRVVQEELPDETPAGPQGWWFNTRLAKFSDPRIREAITLLFDFEATNRDLMFDSYIRMQSFFENSPMKAEGPPSPEELALLEPYRAELPAEVFGEPWVPPVSDGSGRDRALSARALELLTQAGCRREQGGLVLPNGERFTITFLDFSPALQPHTQRFQASLRRVGIETALRTVDSAQYGRLMDNFEFEMTSSRFGGSLTPGASLRIVYGSEAAATPGSSNLAGVNNRAVDALIDVIAAATTREEITIAARALDRVLRSGRYLVPMWFKASHWIAYWDEFGRPERKPRYALGALDTWWLDREKAARIRRT